MSTFRFGLLAISVFLLIFVGGSWAKRGFPVMVYTIQPLKPDARIPTFEQAVKEGQRRDWVASKTNQSDGNVERDKLRSDLLQAANAYKLSPCDDTVRKNLVEALSNYTSAWHAMAWCTPGVNACPQSRDQRIDVAAAAFKTPADLSLHNVVGEAVEIGGIYKSDFPKSIQNFVFQWGHASPPDEPREACLIARKAASQQ